MGWLDRTVQTLVALLSRALDPVVLLIARIGYEIRHTSDLVGIPYGWQHLIVAAFWVLILLMLVRTTSGWLRLIVALFAALVIAKVYGLLPAA